MKIKAKNKSNLNITSKIKLALPRVGSVISLCLSLCLLSALIGAIPCASARQGESDGYLRLSAKSAALIDANEGNLLYAKNAYERLPMASTTKIMTALVASERLELDCVVEIPSEAVGVEGSSVYLRLGERLTVSELLHALLLESANDAAIALAIAASGSVDAFAQDCNARADSLLLKDTRFKNPHGLYEEGHYTTAYDLAKISAEAMNNPQIREITAKKSATVSLGVTEESPAGEGVRYLKNHNKLLSRYEGAIGVKTGYTQRSGRCLVSAAERDGLRLIAVTLNAPDDWNDHTSLLDFGFLRFERRIIYESGEFYYDFPLSNSSGDTIRAVNISPIEATLPRNAKISSLTVEACFRFAIAPVEKGQALGRLVVCVNGRRLSSALVAKNAAF